AGDRRNTRAERRGILEHAGGGTAVAIAGAAVVALLRRLGDAVAAHGRRRKRAIRRRRRVPGLDLAGLVLVERVEVRTVDVTANRETDVDRPLLLVHHVRPSVLPTGDRQGAAIVPGLEDDGLQAGGEQRVLELVAPASWGIAEPRPQTGRQRDRPRVPVSRVRSDHLHDRPDDARIRSRDRIHLDVVY